jgi:hypothetical protein
MGAAVPCGRDGYMTNDKTQSQMTPWPFALMVAAGLALIVGTTSADTKPVERPQSFADVCRSAGGVPAWDGRQYQCIYPQGKQQ